MVRVFVMTEWWYWFILLGVFLLLEFYGLIQNRREWIAGYLPRVGRLLAALPKTGTLSGLVWSCKTRYPALTGFVLGALFTGLTFHFLLTGWCAP